MSGYTRENVVDSFKRKMTKFYQDNPTAWNQVLELRGVTRIKSAMTQGAAAVSVKKTKAPVNAAVPDWINCICVEWFVSSVII